MTTRHQDHFADLDQERLLKRFTQSAQSTLNEAGTLEEISNGHHLVPAPSDLSRQANGSHRRGPTKVVGAMLVAAKNCGAPRSLAERYMEEWRWFIAALWSDDVPDPEEVLSLEALADVDQDRVREEVRADGVVTPDEYGRLAEATRRELGRKREFVARAEQVAREGRMS